MKRYSEIRWHGHIRCKEPKINEKNQEKVKQEIELKVEEYYKNFTI